MKGFKLLIKVIEVIGLFVIVLATIISAGQEIHHMWVNQKVTLSDLLLLFIYLEVLAMIAIYLDSGKLPIRYPIYIGIVALARYLILDIKQMDEVRMLSIGATIILLTLAVFLLRYGHNRFPYEDERKLPLTLSWKTEETNSDSDNDTNKTRSTAKHSTQTNEAATTKHAHTSKPSKVTLGFYDTPHN